MSAVKMPRLVIAAVVLCLFALALYASREYSQLGVTSHLALALGAGAACLAIVGGLIYANYASYRTDPDRRLNGTP
ncbi:MAG TPA: hypothetical protein VF184_05770 [Phycisphaeraceae bacterium]